MQQGGLSLSDTETIMPKPLLVGRNAAKLEAISKECGGLPWTTDLDAALADPALLRLLRRADNRPPGASGEEGDHRQEAYLLRKADRRWISEVALDLYELAKKAGVKHGVVQDKLWLPGLLKMTDTARNRLFR